MSTAERTYEQESVNVHDLRPGDRIFAWRGDWLVLDPPLRKAGRVGQGHVLLLRTRDAWKPEITYEIEVTPQMEFATLRAER